MLHCQLAVNVQQALARQIKHIRPLLPPPPHHPHQPPASARFMKQDWASEQMNK
jgi:hypothetical protein